MTDKKIATTATENTESSTEDVEAAASLKKKKSKKLPITLGVIAAVIIVAGAGLWVWHEQPSFCNAICHTPMDPYLPTYESEINSEGIDKWGNTVSDTNAMLAPVHRAENENTCMSCHVPVLSEQVAEAVNWISGNYEVVTTQTGMQVISECTLEDLTEAQGIEPDKFCLNDNCHNMTRADLEEATKDLGMRNPHEQPHGDMQCSECHKAHRASVNACTGCHNDAPVPDGWLTASQSKSLEKGLSS